MHAALHKEPCSLLSILAKETGNSQINRHKIRKVMSGHLRDSGVWICTGASTPSPLPSPEWCAQLPSPPLSLPPLLWAVLPGGSSSSSVWLPEASSSRNRRVLGRPEGSLACMPDSSDVLIPGEKCHLLLLPSRQLHPLLR